MSEGIRGTLSDIKIQGGVHNKYKGSAPTELDEEAIQSMVGEMAQAIKNHTHMDSWIQVTFKKTIGTKVNS